jgi:hypothetical protein
MNMPNPDKVPYLYFGNLLPSEPQYRSGLFLGLALKPLHDKEIFHDAAQPLPFVDGSVAGIQSQDVFEHIEYDRVTAILDEVFRCLQPGAMFRLSLPDYNSPLLQSRSAYNAEGKILCDLAMGGLPVATMSGGISVRFSPNGEAHLWFPTYTKVLHLILASQIRKCSSIEVHHAWLDRHDFICREFEHGNMPVIRVPPRDMRAGGAPISIVIDFVK